jgi:hypothetical protein
MYDGPMDEPHISKTSVVIKHPSKTVRPVNKSDIITHISSITHPLPYLKDTRLSVVLLSIGCIYVIQKDEKRYTVMYTTKGLRQLEGPKSKDGSTTYYKGFVEWCTKIGATYEEIQVAGRPKTH